VKAPDVDGHVERSTDPREPSHVTHKEGRRDLVLGDTLLRLRDRDRREVDSGRQQPANARLEAVAELTVTGFSAGERETFLALLRRAVENLGKQAAASPSRDGRG
jgi:hypothetical protein